MPTMSPPIVEKTPLEASPWNYTNIYLDDLKMDSNFAWLLCSLVTAIAWLIYISYYNSRVVGYIFTRVLNSLYVTEGHFSVGSLSFCCLSGKVMFRDIVYITHDFTARIQDGWTIFRWWRAYVPKDVSEDFSHSDTRLSVMLNGFELHVYHRSQLYARLERLFDLEPSIIPRDPSNPDKFLQENEKESLTSRERPQPGSSSLGKSWRDLIPVIKMDLSSGRLVFGNRLVPNTLSIQVEEAHFMYSTKPAASRLDHFMHIVKCKAENFKVILAPSPKYVGISDDPPRYMGEGFVVLSSNNVDLYFYMDEPGVVPSEPCMLQLANGDIVESTPPIWGIDIKCGKGTDFSYGPWADKQREHLFHFFFPQEYQPLKINKPPMPGEKRQVQSFDIRLSTLSDATIDILFSKNKETNAVHVNIGPGSYLEVTIPWIVTSTGYTTKVTGQLLHLEATTSLQYRSLLESETLEFSVACHYPLEWNGHQEWLLNLTGCKATVWFIYAHKEFFQELVIDWSSKVRADLLQFVPYTWKFTVLMKEFEFIMPANEYNWIDCSSQSNENMYIAFCGELFDFSFDLPFVDFLPLTLPLKFWIQGESMDLSVYLPEIYTSRSTLLSLHANAKLLGRDGNITRPRGLEELKKWRNHCHPREGWLDCWSVPIVALSINYIYHPMPPLGPAPQADITTPEKEEILLSPMRIQRNKKSPVISSWKQEELKFDPTSLEPDEVSLELEVGPSQLLIYGSWLLGFVHLKENIFGDDQSFTDMNQSPELHLTPGSSREPSSSITDDSSLKEEFDPRKYRPLSVNVSITMHDIQAHLVKNCSDKEPPCPLILVDRFGFEMKKNYRETLLQLVLSPAVLLSSDLVSSRPPRDRHLNQGHLTLSGLQLRGHAMFSDEGRSLQDETLEYAWLLELQLGKLSGRMTIPQMYHVISSLEALFLLAVDSENRLVPPKAPPPCHHNNIPIDCPESQPSATYRCPPPDQIKYRMVRVCVDALDIYVLESGTAINFWACPIRFSTCNLHGNQVKSGLTGVIPCIQVKQMIITNNLSANNTTGSGRSQHRNTNEPEMWLEVGSISLGPLILEAAASLSKTDENLHLVQQRYLKEHDEKTRRLWLLWPGEKAGRCGCIGGCCFFGSNANGPRFFRPTKQDIIDGLNIAAFRVNEGGKDPGYGQSILHENQLVFHTPPYNRQEVSLYDVVGSRPPSAPIISHSKSMKDDNNSKVERSKSVTERKIDTPSPIPTVKAPSSSTGVQTITLSVSTVTTATGPAIPVLQTVTAQSTAPVLRRFSYTPSTPVQSRSAGSCNGVKEVPYSRLVDSSPTAIPDAESALSDKLRNVLMVGEGDNNLPKSSISDSKLAVEYFNSTAQQYSALVNSAKQVGLEASESEQSLQDRTQSITSDTHPEAFFSAEEGLASRSSSLRRNQMTECDWSGKRFGSDMNIVSRGWCCNHSSISPRPAHSSDIEMHYPQDQCVDGGRCLPPPMFHRASPRSDLTTHLDSNIQEGLTVLLDSSDTHSISSTSFISAVSSQEDLTMVNLHMQVNKPIVDSPLLMTTYINHLSQATCTNWAQSAFPSGTDAFTLPLFNKTDDGKLVYIGSELIPKFETQVEGFTALKMANRCRSEISAGSPPHSIGKTPTHPYSWDFMLSETCTEQNNQNRQSEELLSVRNDTGTRTTVVVKLKGDIDIMITPLALESLQRFIDGVTPTLAMLHPVTILNEVHLRCMGQVEASNILKRDQYLSQLQGGGSKRSTAERGRPSVGTNDKSHCVIEQCIATQVQATIILPKINIALLQASVVEEMISFSALDNIRDLTCVSLLAVSFENLTVSFHRAKQTREVVERLERPAVLPGGVKKSGFAKKVLLLGPRTSSTKHVLTGETVFVETSQNQHQETVLSINLNKVDAQLRRLDNECSLLKDAEITAIPSHCSRVMFSVKLDKCAMKNQLPHLEHNSRPIEDPYFMDQPDEKLGFIMFEGGLQGVSFKIVKRSKFNIDEPEAPTTSSTEEQKSSGDHQNKSDSQKTPSSEPTKIEVTINEPDCHKEAELQAVVVEQPPPSAESHRGDGETGTKEHQPQSNVRLTNKSFGNLSSCIIDVKQVWFNFAAPPRTPITKKIDYTRLDWNLLSTASPAINAWMNPSNRFAIRVVHMLRCRYRRSTSVVTSLMADALDVQPLQMPTKSHYGRFTPLCNTLQEDPSCQLCSVLKRFAITSKNTDDNLREQYLPHLSTLRQGVIVLSRQWKNILYTPLLLEHSLKSKHHLAKPCNVTFAVPDPEDQDNILTDGEFSYEECEITDESAMLLNTAVDSKKVLKPQKSADGPPICSPLQPSSHAFSSPTSPSSNNQSSGIRKRCLLPTQVPSSSRASIVFPLFSNSLFKQDEPPNHPAGHQGGGYSTLKEDYPRVPHLGSNPSISSRRQGSIESVCEEGRVESEDLYTWMQQQMGSSGGQTTVPPPPASTPTIHPQNPTNRKEVLSDMGKNPGSAPGGGMMNPDYLLLSSGYSLYPMHDSLKLLDAHLIFEPLLTSLGVMPQQMITSTGMRSNSVDCWGTNMSLVGCVESMKVDIVVSEFGKPQDKKAKSKSETMVKLWVEVPPEAPAFVCEKIWLELDVSRRTDTGLVEDLGRQRRNTLYVSRGQLKKHSTTALNISVSIRYISQQVNMPLLRLLLQISNMYQNVKETQSELREQRPPADRPPTASNSNHQYNPLGGVSVDESEPGSRRDDEIPKVRPSSSASHHFRANLSGPSSVSAPGVTVPTPVPGRASSVVSPSSSLRAAQSFTNRIRSTSRSVRGYVNLSEGSQLTSPMCPDERRLYNKEESTPRCWKTVYNLLDLYASMPHTKTIAHSRFSVGGGEASDSFRSKKSDASQKDQPPTPILNPSDPTNAAGPPCSAGSEERTRLMIFAVARIHRTRLLATLSGLKLEAEMSNLHSSLTVRKKTQKLQPSMEASLTAHVGRTMIVLLEGVPPNQQTVVKILIGKSQALFSSLSLPGKDKNSALLTVSAIGVTIPQHPVALHGMMARGSKHLSSTLQELRVSRTTSRVGREESDQTAGGRPQSPVPRPAPTPTPSDSLLKPLTIQFTIVVQSLSITAALLPSLQAQYRMEHVTSTGVTAGKVKFVIDLPNHSLSFSTKATEANLPSEANIALPKVHVTAEYIQDNHPPNSDRQFGDGVVLRHGNYLNALADIGIFEHSLTTDLLNHLVFVQKVFMKEVNEVVQKVYGGEKPVPLWEDDGSHSSSKVKQILFSLGIRLKRIQLTAVTPTNCAVRLETGCVDLQLSNRVENVSGRDTAQPNTSKLFAKANVEINLSLGQLIRNALFEEAEPEFQQYAFFKTRIELRNAFQGETGGGGGEGKEVVVITLRRPLVYIQPMAVDKAILVWLNYKNAYEYWNEQRSSLNTEVLTATQQVFEKMPFEKLTGGPPFLGTLFLQLTVKDMGICLPLNPLPHPSWGRQLYADDSCSAVVVTLESTSICACSWGSLVSKARFSGLCLRFADDFETSLDDWKPDPSQPQMNLCVVSEGTYEVCSRTLAAQKIDSENAKWFLNVQWAMEGVDIHLDVNIGKQLSGLGHTLTTLTGYQEDDPPNQSYDSDCDPDQPNTNNSQESPIIRRGRVQTCDSLSMFALDPSIDAKKRSKLIEKEINEQAKFINDLRSLGASYGTIEQEMKRLRELENIIFKNFRRDMMQKLKRQSVKTSLKKRSTPGKAAFRSRSFIVPSPTPEHALEIDSPDGSSLCSSPPTTCLFSRNHNSSSRVTFSESHNLTRQSSLPSASSELSLPVEGDLSEWNASNRHSAELIPSADSPQSNYNGLGVICGEGESSLSGGSSTGAMPLNHKPTEPSVDFELDVKVLIKSGKCVLHTKDTTVNNSLRAEENELNKSGVKLKKERSCSGGMFEFGGGSSPSMSRRSNKQSTSRLRHPQHTVTLSDFTVFHIPGLDVKVHYESKTLMEVKSEGGNTPAGASATNTPASLSTSINPGSSRRGTKKASLFAWMTLQSIPEETVISPHILDFLEQTLEPIPTQQKSPSFQSGGTTSVGDPVAMQYYASFPVDVIVYFHMQPSTFRFSCLPVSRVECMLQLPSVDIVFSSKRSTPSGSSSSPGIGSGFTVPGTAGGISVTSCLSDFSLYIFHPYGGKKSGVKEAQWSPLQDTERKDSLSVNVEFVKLHLSRSNHRDPTTHHQVVRFSTIVDIGSAWFKYDMRRLTEILAFPKAWYRRSIVRRLFLGDISSSHPAHDNSDIDITTSNVTSSNEKSNLTKDKMNLHLDPSHNLHYNIGEGEISGESSPGEKGPPAWETLVLFAVHFKRLNVHMNMGNVMGNVMLMTKDLRSEGRLSIGSCGHKNMYVGLGLAGATLDAKGGIVGGTIDLANIDTFMVVKEERGTEPDHLVGLKLVAVEFRLDYMGTAVLMSRISSLETILRDEWNQAKTSHTRRTNQIFVHGDLGWDQLQMMISKSTTVDLLKMYAKLEEFFMQQFNSSKRVFSSLGRSDSQLARSSRPKKHNNNSDQVDCCEGTRHHRHWQRALGLTPECGGTILGGTLDLHGTNISLACFHGINFKSKSWALFSLKEPFISFSTEAQQVPSNETCPGALDSHIIQTLTLSLGLAVQQQAATAHHHSMATVCRVSRNIVFPPQFKTLHEWFHYAFSCSDIDAVDRFPCVEREREGVEGGVGRARAPPRPPDPNHTREVIFALPSFQTVLKTEHLQPSLTPSTHDPEGKPCVDCSFVTEFEDHIFVTVDAECFFFLHDLITSYVREKDKIGGGSSRGPSEGDSSKSRREGEAASSTSQDSSTGQPSIQLQTNLDWRNFQCKTWHLEPTVRLLSWGGKSIEPYGVDYILQKLGFSQARLTIPKWMQRGFMDPLDKVLSLLVSNMLQIAPDITQENKNSNN